jgi:hypothetical protein
VESREKGDAEENGIDKLREDLALVEVEIAP